MMGTLYYELERAIGFDEADYLEVAVHFISRCTVKAYAGDCTDPPWPAEYEHTLDGMEIIEPGCHAPLTDAERAQIAAWFETRTRECDELAAADDDFGERADYEYDRRRDELTF
jgi:hypothetical protein